MSELLRMQFLLTAQPRTLRDALEKEYVLFPWVLVFLVVQGQEVSLVLNKLRNLQKRDKEPLSLRGVHS